MLRASLFRLPAVCKAALDSTRLMHATQREGGFTRCGKEIFNIPLLMHVTSYMYDDVCNRVTPGVQSPIGLTRRVTLCYLLLKGDPLENFYSRKGKSSWS